MNADESTSSNSGFLIRVHLRSSVAENHMPKLSIHIASFVLVLLLSACAALRPGIAPVSENPAVLTLVEQARAEVAENKLQSAVAIIERAQRLEPRNPWLRRERRLPRRGPRSWIAANSRISAAFCAPAHILRY